MLDKLESIGLIWGAKNIAKHIGRSQRQTFHMLQEGQIPAKKIGERWVADPKKLEQFFSEAMA